MKNKTEWLNEVGETVAFDLFCSNPNNPGSKTELLVDKIQSDARADLLTDNALLKKKIEDYGYIFAYGSNAMAGHCRAAIQRIRQGEWTVDDMDKWLEEIIARDAERAKQGATGVVEQMKKGGG